MPSKNKLLFALCAILLMTTIHSSFADVHMITATNKTYAGYPLGKELRLEVWLSEDSECIITAKFMTIKRYDLNKIWRLDLNDSTYKESFIEKKDNEPAEENAEEELHNEGYVYEPVFDWIIKDTGEVKKMCGIPCRKLLLDGDADYAEHIMELWVADDLRTKTDINDQSLRFFRGHKATEIYEDIPELEGLFIMYEHSVLDRAIGKRAVSDTEVIVLEDVDPPAGIYELPYGFKKTE
jgi:hypothetical protein